MSVLGRNQTLAERHKGGENSRSFGHEAGKLSRLSKAA
jgi:hypothetical protein